MRAPGLYLLALLIFLSAAAFADPPAPGVRQVNVKELYAKADILEQAGEYEKAREICRQILIYDSSYDVHIRLGWLNYNCGDLDAAGEHYAVAAEKCGECADPLLGLQLVAIGSENWEEALRAGDKALALDSKNYWAVSRKALAYYMLGRYASARAQYLKALDISPDEPEMLLGLGFTRILQGARAEGRGHCLKAGRKLENDPRVTECLRMAETALKLKSVSRIFATYMVYSDPWNLRDIRGLTATSALYRPSGYGMWAGAAVSETTRRYVVDDYQHDIITLGASGRKDKWEFGLNGAWLFSNEDTVDDSPLAIARIGRRWGKTDLTLITSGVFYRDFDVYQFELPMGYNPAKSLKLVLKPELIIVDEHDLLIPEEKSIDTEYLTSAQALIYWNPGGRVDIFVDAFFGRQRYAVESGGLAVWTGDDLFVAGYNFGAAIQLGRYFKPYAYAHNRVGAEQAYRDHDFSVWGGTLGFELKFHGG